MKAVKYTFDNHFGSPGTRAVPKPAEQKFDAKAVEVIRQESFKAGFSAGRDEALAQSTHQLAEALGAVLRQLQGIQSQTEARNRAAKQDAARIAHLIGLKLAGTLLAERPASEVEALVSDCLATCDRSSKLLVKVNEGLAAELQEKVETLRQQQHFDGDIVVIGDSSIALGDGRVEWRDGGAERCSSTIESAIADIVERYVHSLSGADLYAAEAVN